MRRRIRLRTMACQTNTEPHTLQKLTNMASLFACDATASTRRAFFLRDLLYDSSTFGAVCPVGSKSEDANAEKCFPYSTLSGKTYDECTRSCPFNDCSVREQTDETQTSCELYSFNFSSTSISFSYDVTHLSPLAGLELTGNHRNLPYISALVNPGSTNLLKAVLRAAR